MNRRTPESRERNMDSVSTRGRIFPRAKKVWAEARERHGAHRWRTGKNPEGRGGKGSRGLRNQGEAVDAGTDTGIHRESVAEKSKGEDAVGLYEALGNELPASCEACAETESKRHLKVGK